jgi:CheY-like chemotaxis protein
MRALLIDDNIDYGEDVRVEMEARGMVVSVARSRDSAVEALTDAAYDLIICDLDLPPTDGDLGTNTDHGAAVRAKIEEWHPGTPVIVHSAYGSVEYLGDMVRKARTRDLYGTGQEPLVTFIPKDALPELLQEASRIRDELRSLRDIEIVVDPPALNLDRFEARTLAIVARRHNGRRVDAEAITGGLSGAHVFRAVVRNDLGAITAAVVVKVDNLKDIGDEIGRYRTHVGSALGFGRFANLTDEVVAGAGPKGALCYSVAEDYDRSLYEALAEAPAQSAEIIARIRDTTRRWTEHAPIGTHSVGELRRRHIADERLEPAVLIAAPELEQRMVQVRDAIQHGDLHGLNVLFRRDFEPAIIDFGNAGESIATFDPVALELSLVFHPEGRRICGGWPSVEVAAKWPEVVAYTEECPFSEFVRACRSWATDVAPGQRAVLAAAYIYVAKQFRYSDTSKEVASAMLKAIVEAWG